MSGTVALSATEVLERYSERLSDERTRLSECSAGMLETAKELTGVSNALSSIAEGKSNHALGLGTTRPLIGHLLLSKAYKDLANSGSIGSEVQGLIGNDLLEFLDITKVEIVASGEVDGDKAARPGKCSYIEFGFSMVAEQAMGRDVLEINRQPDIWVYHDEEGKPLVIRKIRDENNGLLLEPCELSGITVPAGTSVGLGINMTAGGEATGEHIQADGTRLFTRSVPQELSLTPLRLTPWAHEDMLDRAFFAVDTHNKQGHRIDTGGRLETVTSYSLQDFKDAATNVMILCGAQTQGSQQVC